MTEEQSPAMNFRFRMTLLIALAVTLAGCGGMSVRERDTVIGAGVGAAAGAAVTNGDAAGTDAAQPPAAADAPPRSPPPPPVAQNAAPPTNATVAKPDPNQMTQEQQVEAIRARIEARRAQMRAEAESAAAANHQQK